MSTDGVSIKKVDGGVAAVAGHHDGVPGIWNRSLTRVNSLGASESRLIASVYRLFPNCA